VSDISRMNAISTVGRVGNNPAPLGDPSTIVKALGFLPNSSSVKLVTDAATTGRIPDYVVPECTKGPSVGFGTQVGIVAKQSLISAGLSAVPVVGGLLANFSGLFSGAKHAQAVQTEREILCQAVPEANGFLLQIDQALAAGQMTTDDAITQMEGAFAQWMKEVGPIYQEGPNKCNAACINGKAFRAAIEKRKQDYALQTNTQARGSKGFQGQAIAQSAVVGAIDTVFQKPASLLIKAGLVPASSPGLAILIVAAVGVVGSYALYAYLRGRKM
jgi:hypothetical protein